jgi:hypothetical protein
VIDVYLQAVTICIKKANYRWFCSAIYGSPQLVNRENYGIILFLFVKIF